MNRSPDRLWLASLARILWAATLLTLPVTSFRYFPAGEGTYVRPLAFLPLAALLLVMLVRLLTGELEPPRSAVLTPLAAFILMVAIASAVGILLDPAPMRGQDVAGRALRGWITLLMGVGFFVGALWMNRTESELRFSIRWLLIGFTVDALWSSLQAATFYLHVLPKPLVTHWQRLFSLRELIRTNRISGMAYEPSWLAAQIATIYLPWLIAGMLTRVRVLRPRWLEFALLAAALLMVLATFSRGGILMAALSAGLVMILAGRAELAAVWGWFTSRPSSAVGAVVRIGAVAGTILALVGSGLWLAQKGYISRLWEVRSENLADFLVQNSAGARGAYLVSAYETFDEHPWTGVGLGASGLYMYSRLPDWAMTSVPEVARQLSPESSLYPNPKNLYVRLLSETGLPGLILYASFMFILLAHVLQALRQPSTVLRYAGLAGLCTWIAVLLFNMTQDSLATPNIWLNLGMLTGLIGSPLWSGAHMAPGPGSAPRSSPRSAKALAGQPR